MNKHKAVGESPPPLVIIFKKEKNEDENKKEINICDIRRDIDTVNAYRCDADDCVCRGGNLCS